MFTRTRFKTEAHLLLAVGKGARDGEHANRCEPEFPMCKSKNWPLIFTWFIKTFSMDLLHASKIVIFSRG